MEFFMALRPPTVTAQEKKIAIRCGKPVFYEPQELKAARALLTDSLAKYKPDAPLQGPLELLVKWIFWKDPPGTPDPGWHEWKVSKPDTDNLDKLLKDCMTRTGFWEDDAQVCREIIEKHWGGIPGIYIRLEVLA